MDKIKIRMKDKKTGYVLKWFGGNGIHVYEGKEEIAFYNIGNAIKDEASPEEVKSSMKEMIREGNYSDYG